jgi:hypothetical protein
MFIEACLKCYKEEEHGPIVKVERVSADDWEMCEDCGEPIYYVYTRNESGIADGDYSHTSASLAINPCQTKAHRKLFPGVDVLPDGRIGFNSVKQQSDYLKKTGFVKHPQKIKKKGERIA